MIKYALIALIIFILTSTHVSAQSVKGNWYGTGAVDLPVGTNTYLSELVLNEKNKALSGVFNYYFRDSLFSNKIEGTYYDAARRLSLNKQNIIFYKSTSTKTGVDCPMYGEFTLRVSRTESILKGVLFSDNDHQFTCPTINFNLVKSTDTVSLKRNVTVATTIDTIKKIQPPVKIDVLQETFITRPKKYVLELDINNPTIKIELYDNGQIDYDSVTIYLNSKLVVPTTMLTHKAITITLALDETLAFNELSMFANNVGLIPPNTAAMILYDGTTRHEIMMSSDLDRTATIKLKRKPR